jgi:hypothetical protein
LVPQAVLNVARPAKRKSIQQSFEEQIGLIGAAWLVELSNIEMSISGK